MAGSVYPDLTAIINGFRKNVNYKKLHFFNLGSDEKLSFPLAFCRIMRYDVFTG